MEIQVKKLTSARHADWIGYVQGTNASIYHDPKWCELIKKVFGQDSHHLMAYRNNQVVGIFPLVQLKSAMFGNFLVSMPYFNYGGIVADDDDVLHALMAAAHDLSAELGCSHTEIRFDSEQPLGLSLRTDKVTMLLELPESEEPLWRSIGAKRRAQVKRPVREGAVYKFGGIELLDEFYMVFSRNMRDLGTPVYSKNFFREILLSFRENAFIALVEVAGKPAGAGFLIGHEGKLEIPWASTLREYNRIGVNMFLYWNILKTAIEKGYAVFDFGRSSKDAGTLKFKKQWGAEEKQLYWYYDLPAGAEMPGLNPSNNKFSLAISAWQKLPVSVANVLGPPIVKNLP